MSTDAWAREALALLAEGPDVRRVGLAVSEGGGRRHRFTASDRHADVALDWCHVDAYEDVPLNTVVRTGVPVVGSLDDLAERYPAFIDHQRGTPSVAVAAAPLLASGQTLGGFVLYFELPQLFDIRQCAELSALGERLGRDLRAAQGREQRAWPSLAQEPVPDGAAAVTHHVSAELEAVADARRFADRTLARWGVDEETAADAVLCLSELVTNALIHTESGCEVRILLDHGILTTAVRDGGSGGLAGAVGDPLRVHGRGLQVVDALADRWGSRLDTVGTTVWFVLEPGHR
ncbi:MAG TPA: ATP-binding protein [Marmoricola sp.]|nr:ATP-binding protein [Marmoricola sp.]